MHPLQFRTRSFFRGRRVQIHGGRVFGMKQVAMRTESEKSISFAYFQSVRVCQRAKRCRLHSSSLLGRSLTGGRLAC